MAIEVRIHREFDDFKLDVQFQSEVEESGSSEHLDVERVLH